MEHARVLWLQISERYKRMRKKELKRKVFLEFRLIGSCGICVSLMSLQRIHQRFFLLNVVHHGVHQNYKENGIYHGYK